MSLDLEEVIASLSLEEGNSSIALQKDKSSLINFYNKPSRSEYRFCILKIYLNVMKDLQHKIAEIDNMDIKKTICRQCISCMRNIEFTFDNIYSSIDKDIDFFCAKQKHIKNSVYDEFYDISYNRFIEGLSINLEEDNFIKQCKREVRYTIVKVPSLFHITSLSIIKIVKHDEIDKLPIPTIIKQSLMNKTKMYNN